MFAINVSRFATTSGCFLPKRGFICGERSNLGAPAPRASSAPPTTGPTAHTNCPACESEGSLSPRIFSGAAKDACA